jgi:hypothetical protein
MTKQVLDGYKREGKKLVPPLMLLPNLVETSFRDSKIPELIWISGLFSALDAKDAVNLMVEFIIECDKAIYPEKIKPLAFLSNFQALTELQKQKIKEHSGCNKYTSIISRYLDYQNYLFDNYPLAFIFSKQEDVSRSDAINRLMKDVVNLLDRNSFHAMKVQTAALASMMATGKLVMHMDVGRPDLNKIYTDPESSEGRLAASFVRASLNAGASIHISEEIGNKWVESFWIASYDFEGCI